LGVTDATRALPNCRLLGPTAIELVQQFRVKMRFADRDILQLKTYIPGPGVEQRLKFDVRSLACMSAQQLLARHPALEALAKQLVRGVEVDESRDMIPVRAAELALRLPALVSNCKKSKMALALYSICRNPERKVWHIPMIDFQIESGKEIGQLRLLKECLRKLHQTDDVLLDSGRSYHFYGFRRLSQREWLRLMEACLLLSPLVDIRYIAHRMLAGKASLRLTDAPRNEKVPEIVACLH
jgi:hypothetical protein